jgi:hypothetical protein
VAKGEGEASPPPLPGAVQSSAEQCSAVQCSAVKSTRLNETEVRVLSLGEGLTKVNGSLAATTGRVATLETATGRDRSGRNPLAWPIFCVYFG